MSRAAVLANACTRYVEGCGLVSDLVDAEGADWLMSRIGDVHRRQVSDLAKAARLLALSKAIEAVEWVTQCIEHVKATGSDDVQAVPINAGIDEADKLARALGLCSHGLRLRAWLAQQRVILQHVQHSQQRPYEKARAALELVREWANAREDVEARQVARGISPDRLSDLLRVLDAGSVAAHELAKARAVELGKVLSLTR